jgi:hypothetical protein
MGRLATNQELLTLLRASKLVKFIMIVDRCAYVGIDVSLSQKEDQSQAIDGENGMQIVVRNQSEATIF